MPEFSATMTFQVVYRSKPAELTTGERAQLLAETMLEQEVTREALRKKW